MDDHTLREKIRDMLQMNASPHQTPRDPANLARAFGSRGTDPQRLIQLIREEAGRLHINIL